MPCACEANPPTALKLPAASVGGLFQLITSSRGGNRLPCVAPSRTLPEICERERRGVICRSNVPRRNLVRHPLLALVSKHTTGSRPCLAGAFIGGDHDGQKAEIAERPFSRHAQGRLLRRKQDPQNAAENGEGRTVERPEGSLPQAREGSPRPGQAARTGVQDHGQETSSQDM